jgi:hypothetical protein
LGVPTDESYVLAQLSEQHKAFASIAEWPIMPEVRSVLRRSWDHAAQTKTRLTLAHLVCAMMVDPLSVLCQSIKEFDTTELDQVREGLKNFAAAQRPMHNLPLGMTKSFRSAIESAYDTSKHVLRGVVTERLLCWTTVRQNCSSAAFLARSLTVAQEQLAKKIVDLFFTTYERNNLGKMEHHVATYDLESSDYEPLSIQMVLVEHLRISKPTMTFLIEAGIHGIATPFTDDDEITDLPGITTEQIDEVRRAINQR